MCLRIHQVLIHHGIEKFDVTHQGCSNQTIAINLSCTTCAESRINIGKSEQSFSVTDGGEPLFMS